MDCLIPGNRIIVLMELQEMRKSCVKELMRLGILTITIPLGTVIICSIGVAIADNFFPEIEKLSLDGYASVGLGIMMIVVSFFCRYGAEVKEEKANVESID